jgi:hypothetical protein
MNGCELPCGTILRVEPADSSCGSSLHYGAAPVATEKPEEDTVVEDKTAWVGEDETEDLDGFFASLT